MKKLKKFNIIITNDGLAKNLEETFENKGLKYTVIPKSRGYSYKFALLEYMGFADTDRTIIVFRSSETTRKRIENFIFEKYNKKNNGIMFSIGDNFMKAKNRLLVSIVNAGKANKVMDVIRITSEVGSTVIDGRGSGVADHKLFGISIDSNKEIVLTVMPSTKVTKTQKEIQKSFKDDNTDVVCFELPVENFTKLYDQEKN